VLTLFSIPKPFEGHVGIIQRNALRSWCALVGVQVVLVGDEEGVAEAAAEAGGEHVGGVQTNEYGTPRLDDAFARVDAVARHPLRCLVNADVVLLDDFLPAVERVHTWSRRFLVVGRTLDVAIDVPLALERRDVRDELAARTRSRGRSRGATAIDYFVFTAGLFDPMPAFVIGRARFDNWLLWRARSRAPVVDATRAIVAVHQQHDYAHVAGGHDEAHFGPEAAANLALAGGKRRVYTIHDASHVLSPDGRIRRHLGAFLRVRENLRKASWKLARSRQ